MIRTSRQFLFLLGLLAGCIFSGLVITYYKINNTSITEKNKQFQAIIFDLDGTIIDTDPLWKQAGFCVLQSCVPTLEEIQIKAFIETCEKLGVYDTVAKIVEHLKNNHNVELTTDELFAQSMPHLRKIYQEQGIKFIPHFEDFYKKVVDAKIKTAIATSSQQHLVELITTILPLESHFKEHIYHVDHVNRAYKPKPDIYLHAAEKIGVKPEACIAIEDSATGIKAAKAAGMYCVGINTGKNRDALKQADIIVDCYSHIDLDKLLAALI